MLSAKRISVVLDDLMSPTTSQRSMSSSERVLAAIENVSDDARVKSDKPYPVENDMVPDGQSDTSASRLTEYELSTELGDGAYGTVILAHHKKSMQTVAVKNDFILGDLAAGLVAEVSGRIDEWLPTQRRREIVMAPQRQPLKPRLEEVSKIGDGTYGDVYLALLHGDAGKLVRDSKQRYAVKKMKNIYPTWNDALKEMEIVVASEVKRHPNIIHMLEAFRDAGTQQLYMVFEYMDCNLYQLMKDRSLNAKRFVCAEIKSISSQIFRGLQYLHEKGYFHRDLKPENILCKGTEVIKLADFGQARSIRSRPPYSEYVSTRWYRAPELVLSSKVYSLGVDLWAVGCIVAEVVMLRPLFDGSSAADQLFKIVKLLGTPTKEEWAQGYQIAEKINMSFPQGFQRQNLASVVKPCSQPCVDVVAATLLYNPQKRPSARSCLEMEYFTNIKSPAASGAGPPRKARDNSKPWRRQMTESTVPLPLPPPLFPSLAVEEPSDHIVPAAFSSSTVLSPSRPIPLTIVMPSVKDFPILSSGDSVPEPGFRPRERASSLDRFTQLPPTLNPLGSLFQGMAEDEKTLSLGRSPSEMNFFDFDPFEEEPAAVAKRSSLPEKKPAMPRISPPVNVSGILLKHTQGNPPGLVKRSSGAGRRLSMEGQTCAPVRGAAARNPDGGDIRNTNFQLRKTSVKMPDPLQLNWSKKRSASPARNKLSANASSGISASPSAPTFRMNLGPPAAQIEPQTPDDFYDDALDLFDVPVIPSLSSRSDPPGSFLPPRLFNETDTLSDTGPSSHRLSGSSASRPFPRRALPSSSSLEKRGTSLFAADKVQKLDITTGKRPGFAKDLLLAKDGSFPGASNNGEGSGKPENASALISAGFRKSLHKGSSSNVLMGKGASPGMPPPMAVAVGLGRSDRAQGNSRESAWWDSD